MDGLGTGIANAIASGMQGATQGYSKGLQQAEYIKEARQRAKERNYKLKQLQYQQDTRMPEDVVKQQQQVLMEQLKQTQAQIAKQNTFNAFDRYEADGDTRHLNETIKNTPMLQDLYADVAQITPLNPNDPQDRKVMDQLGLNEPNKRYVKVIKKDGTADYVDMMEMYKGTGYANYVDNRTLDKLIKAHQLDDKTKQYAPSAYGKFVEDYKRFHPEATQEEIDKAYGAREQTAKQKDLEAAQDATKTLLEKFGGEDSFFKTNFGDRKNLTKAYPELVKIEKLEGVDFSDTEKKELNDIRTLISLGDPSKNLTKDETGLIDSKLTTIRKYINDSVKGVAATSAYNAFRNSVRHTLYGSALTDAEIQSFNDAFGTLGNQLGPVLQQFKTSLQQVKAKLDSIAKMKNPYSAYIRLGVDQNKLTQIQRAIDERLRFIDEAEQKKAGKPAKRKPLEDIL